VERVRHVAAGWIWMAAVIAESGDELKRVWLRHSRFVHSVRAIPGRSLVDRNVAPAGIRSVVDGVHPPARRDQEVVWIPETGCIDLDGPAWHELCLVLAIVAAERVVRVRITRAGVVIECRQVIGRVTDGREVDLRDGG